MPASRRRALRLQLALSPKRLAGLLLSEPGPLTDAQRERLDAAIADCGEMTMLSGLVRDFAALLDPKDGNDGC
ncbi:hypothetical protein ABZW11_32375 [Nonomuraea sp. NPDC004580]|uniref:hypothetical protein n=1 Tax=Nonomuraea sp. NPDC004580 TaxID=3154552 RepID=UPI0033AA7C8A